MRHKRVAHFLLVTDALISVFWDPAPSTVGRPTTFQDEEAYFRNMCQANRGLFSLSLYRPEKVLSVRKLRTVKKVKWRLDGEEKNKTRGETKEFSVARSKP